MKNVSKILTANRLADGVAVWYGQNRFWVEHVDAAFVATSKDDIEMLETAAGLTLAAGQYCDVVLIDVENSANGLRPLKLRERIRAEGPTIRLDLGKQATGTARSE